jgi:hypothetical protein
MSLNPDISGCQREIEAPAPSRNQSHKYAEADENRLLHNYNINLAHNQDVTFKDIQNNTLEQPPFYEEINHNTFETMSDPSPEVLEAGHRHPTIPAPSYSACFGQSIRNGYDIRAVVWHCLPFPHLAFYQVGTFLVFQIAFTTSTNKDFLQG